MLAFCVCLLILSPLPAQTSQSVRIDSPHAVASIPAPWRFHPVSPADSASNFADAAFNDQTWPLLQPDEPLASAHLPATATGNAWARLHLHRTGLLIPLGIALEARSGQQYIVYANGRLIGSSPGALSGFQQRSTPFTIALPSDQDILLAVHILPRLTLVEPRFPISSLRLGPLNALAATIELDRLRRFDADWLTPIFAGLIYLSFVPIAFILFLARRDRQEYLWLAIFTLIGAAYMFFSVADGVGAFPETLPLKLLYIYSGWGTLITGLEFVGIFVAARRRIPIRILQAIFAAGPLPFFLHAYTAYNAGLAAALLLWMFTVTLYLVAAYRRGQAESGLLMVPFAVIPLFTLIGVLANFYPRIFPLTRRIHIGHIGVGLDDLASVLFIVGILAIVLYRFVRVSRDEQHAAAELEAARNLQQVLIPTSASADLPRIPGYRIASVYRPAREVGGDFFQIIPLTAPGHALVLLGDVSGKGLQAAMTVAVLVGAIRTIAEHTQSPAALLAGLNRLLHGRGTGFTTCVVLRLEPAGRLVAASAGHLPPYLQGDELTLPPGLPLGILGEADYTDLPFTLPPTATLTLLTDGVVEAASPTTRELFGFERTRNLSTQPANFIAEAARAFGPPNAQDDDITVLTITRTQA